MEMRPVLPFQRAKKSVLKINQVWNMAGGEEVRRRALPIYQLWFLLPSSPLSPQRLNERCREDDVDS